MKWCNAFFVFGLALATALPVSRLPAQAPAQKLQTQKQRATRIGTTPENLKIAKDWDKEGKDEQKEFERMRKGDSLVTEENKAILDQAAIWYAYRLTQDIYQDTANTSKTMHELVKQAFGQILDRTDPRKQLTQAQQTFKDEFEKRFIARLSEVTCNRRDIARLNAAMILARIAATNQEDAVDVLLEIIQDPGENDGVRLYAFRGIKEFLLIGRANDSSAFTNKDREARCVRVLLDYLARRPEKLSGGKRELAALSYVRREAVAALGLTRLPAASTTEKKVTTIQRMTAFGLLRVMRKDGIVPEPSIAEQVEAAIGVCQLRSKLCDEYQVDYAADQIGRFLVEFLSSYNGEKDKEVKTEPWKIHAARLIQALDELKTDTERSNFKVYMAKFVSQAQSPLNDILGGKNTPNPTELGTWLDNNKPTSTSLFKDRPDIVIKETEKAEQ